MNQVLFRIATIEETHFEHCNDRVIVIFYEFRCHNLNNNERERTGKGQQTKTENFEHCDDRMFLVSMSTIASFLLVTPPPPLPPHSSLLTPISFLLFLI